jgi:Protein of unknown function (DUF3105)
MSMSTGDSRRPSNRKQSAADAPEPEVVDDAPKGGVLPVKKAVKRPTAATAGADSDAESTPSNGASATTTAGSRANGSAARGGTTNGTTKAAKATPAKAMSAKATTAAAKPSAAKTAPAKAKVTTSKATGARPGGRGPAGYGKGRKPVAPVRVAQSRPWGPIALYTATAILALSIIGFGAWKVIEQENQPTWQEQAAGITGISNYLVSNPEWFQYDQNFGNHQKGELTYPSNPPVGGVHNPQWQNCMGDVYTAQISKEQAVHSLEHGAVWITYKPDLAQDQIDLLASKVRDVPFMMMSPLPDQDKAISLQAWGYQLKLDEASDSRIDEFITALRENATQEPGIGCDRGITDATVKPLDLPGA